MQQLYLQDSYIKKSTAIVVNVEGTFVYLDNTIFYPNGGGQPHDTGVIKTDTEDYNVISTMKMSGKIAHQIDKQGLKPGDKIKAELDWDRRYKLMRMHTAAHILSAVFAKQAGALITGNQLDLEKTRIDFNLENFDREKMNGYIAQANDIVNKDLQIKVYEMSREDIEKESDMVKLAKGLPPMIKQLRIVEIENFDKQPDGGTHVKSTKEVGKIKFLKAENKGKNNRRIYFNLI